MGTGGATGATMEGADLPSPVKCADRAPRHQLYPLCFSASSGAARGVARSWSAGEVLGHLGRLAPVAPHLVPLSALCTVPPAPQTHQGIK